MHRHTTDSHSTCYLANLLSSLSATQPIPMHKVIPSQMQNFAFVFAELQQVLSPAARDSPERQHCPPVYPPLAQFGIIHKFAEGAFCPVSQVVNDNV